MKYITKLIVIFSIVSLYFFLPLISESQSKENGTKLFYEIFYGPLKIGECEIRITSNTYTALVYSVGLANWIYPLYAKWDTWVNGRGLPEKAIIYSKEKNKESKRVIFFREKENQVIYQKLLPKQEKPENIFLEFPIYDELSSFIASFYIDYFKSSQVKLPLFIKKNKHYVKIEFTGEKICEFEKKKSKCLHLKIYLPKKSELLERTSEVDMLLLKDRKVPLELRGKVPIFGSLVGKLKRVEVY